MTEPLTLPKDDRALSPFTGWTRAHWVAVADAILDGAARHASPDGALVRYPGGPGPLGADVDHLEGFARTFMLAAFRIAGDPAGTEGLAERYARGIAAGVDPEHQERWVRLGEHDQAKVEAAALALGLHLTRETVWARLDERTQQQTIEYLSDFIDASYPPNNWAWFRIMTSFFVESVGGPFSEANRDEDFALLDSFDLPGGWTADGVGRNFDHYCGWALPFYPMVWAQLVAGDPRHAERAARYKSRLDDYLDDAMHLIGADGAPLLQGRSLTYRFATAAPVWAAAFHGGSRHDPGLLRRAASGQARHFVSRGAPDADGVLSVGWHHPWRRIAQNYSGPGSPYWASKGMLGLALPATDPVWTAVEQPLPIDEGPFARALVAPGWLAVGTADGVVRVTNHGTDHHVEGSLDPDAPLYAKFGYSTATSPVLAGPNDADPLDGTVALLRDGRPSHRSGFTRGGVRELDAGTLLGSSTARAHWLPGYMIKPNHGVDAHTGEVEVGPLIDTVSVVRGAWEVRFVRVRADGLDCSDQLRVGGWAVTGEMVAGDGAACDGTAGDGAACDGTAGDGAGVGPAAAGPPSGDAWAATERLVSGVVTLTGSDAAASGFPPRSGVLMREDVTPLAGRTAVPWLEVTPRTDEWQAFGIRLGAPGDAAHPRVAADHTITWPDGGTTRPILPA